jgi:hypothetical protein
VQREVKEMGYGWNMDGIGMEGAEGLGGDGKRREGIGERRLRE